MFSSKSKQHVVRIAIIADWSLRFLHVFVQIILKVILFTVKGLFMGTISVQKFHSLFVRDNRQFTGLESIPLKS